MSGATGFIGRHLVANLLDRGSTLYLLSRHQSPADQPHFLVSSDRLEQFEIIYGDIRNFNLMARAIRDAQPDLVIHLAAAGVSNRLMSAYEGIRQNVTGTVNLLRACYDNRLLSKPPSRVLVARTPHEKHPTTMYAASKAAAWNFCESYARSFGWPIIGAMYFQVYGPGQPDHLLIQGAIKAALEGQDYPITSGSQIRDWIYIDDAIEATASALVKSLNPGTSLEIGTGAGTTVGEVVQAIYGLVNRAGQPLVGALPDRPGEISRIVADADATFEALAWRAKTNLNSGLERTIALASSQYRRESEGR